MTPPVTIVVLAKAPVPGRVKTRLGSEFSPAEAAALAEAALGDTLDAVLATPRTRPLLALAGEPGAWLPPGLPVVAQAPGTLDRRIGAALVAAGGPALVIGMDTPQVDPELLGASADLLRAPGTDAVLGPATDGGYWALGCREPDPRCVVGVPMSTAHTAAAQRARLAALGWRVHALPRLRDVDTPDDAFAIAALAPRTRFAARLTGLRGAPVAP